MLSRRCQSDEDWHQVSCHSFPCQSGFCRRRGCGRLPRSACVLFRSPSRSIIHCDRARKRASEGGSGRREGGGREEGAGSGEGARREKLGKRRRAWSGARPGRRRPSARPLSAQPGRCLRLTRSGPGRARIVRAGGGPPAQGPVAGGQGAVLWKHGLPRAGTSARAGAGCGLFGAGRSAGEADSRFAFSWLSEPFGRALPGATNLGLPSNGWKPEQSRTRAGRVESELRPRPGWGAKESGVCRRMGGQQNTSQGSQDSRGQLRGPNPGRRDNLWYYRLCADCWEPLVRWGRRGAHSEAWASGALLARELEHEFVKGDEKHRGMGQDLESAA